MRIDINQRKIAIGDKYRIYIEGQQAFTAERGVFNLLPVIYLRSNPYERPRITIEKRFSFIYPKYDIILHDNNKLAFRTISLLGLHYQCQDGHNLYDIYGHWGRKYSIFKNGVQVAYWNKEAISWFEGDNFTLIADRDSYVELLIAFCLVIDNERDRHDRKNTLNIDFGNFGFWARKFDKNWQPNN